MRRCRSGDVAGHGGHVPPRVPGGRRGAPLPPSNRHQLNPRPYCLGRVTPLPRPSARTSADHRIRATGHFSRAPRSAPARNAARRLCRRVRGRRRRGWRAVGRRGPHRLVRTRGSLSTRRRRRGWRLEGAGRCRRGRRRPSCARTTPSLTATASTATARRAVRRPPGRSSARPQRAALRQFGGSCARGFVAIHRHRERNIRC